uniref:Uncharacterized protein n=1 Tax=Candidatus Kentrum sp. LFY TaxID=2126342 RepID=A0A450US33_9GAMM|nr:MAG: hypothetical protein BECKLFY1418B_GA0070995_100113 [Candidatus Kentron sp. LFY]VFJ95348.1 MAG: hypothetical protein BECKLFY1418A_GA0070994_104921 [Candidatus Kentron sp. LFY]VFK18408.1 MAG: hypothetical protein BECKLFY1418C_GA0070996_104310 [Candidatus Kentron sp. LFY]
MRQTDPPKITIAMIKQTIDRLLEPQNAALDIKGTTGIRICISRRFEP